MRISAVNCLVAELADTQVGRAGRNEQRKRAQGRKGLSGKVRYVCFRQLTPDTLRALCHLATARKAGDL